MYTVLVSDLLYIFAQHDYYTMSITVVVIKIANNLLFCKQTSAPPWLENFITNWPGSTQKMYDSVQQKDQTITSREELTNIHSACSCPQTFCVHRISSAFYYKLIISNLLKHKLLSKLGIHVAPKSCHKATCYAISFITFSDSRLLLDN